MYFNYFNFEKQFSVLKDIFRLAKSKSTFYSERFKNIEEIEDFDDWLKIPFLTREDIYNRSFPHSTDMLTCELENMVVFSTGGTSGIARFVPITHEEWDLFSEVQANALKNLGVNKKDIVANLFVAGYFWPSFLGGHEIIKKIGAIHLPISAITDIEKLIYFFDLFKPTVILSVPPLLIYFADELLKKGKTYSEVRLIQFAGEHLSENGSKVVKKAFPDAEIKAAGYTSADCGLMGYQCDSCSPIEYHVPTDFQFIEIYNFEENRPCKEEELGEVVVTNLKRTSIPIIRYKLGDLAYYKKERCKCKDKNPILVLKGRSGEDFKFGASYIGMNQIEKCFSEFVSKDGISANYQVEIDNLENGKTSFILKIESSDINISKKHESDIRENLFKEVSLFKEGVDADFIEVFKVEFVKLGELPRSPITGKIKRLIDKRIGS